MTEQQDTEERILDAARAVFHEHGYNGARMQEIADRAGINKALLHYYYRSKEKLFEIVFREAARRMFSRIQGILTSEVPLEEKVHTLVANYLDFLLEHPAAPGFILNELGQHEDRLREFIGSIAAVDLTPLAAQIDIEVRAGRVRPIEPESFIVNLIGLCVFPFIARPMLSIILGMDAPHFAAFIEERKRELPVFFLNALRP